MLERCIISHKQALLNLLFKLNPLMNWVLITSKTFKRFLPSFKNRSGLVLGILESSFLNTQLHNNGSMLEQICRIRYVGWANNDTLFVVFNV